MWIPVYRSWRLNERHYGALQGLNKLEMVEKYGEKQVFVWRRSYDVPPPALEDNDQRHPRFDKRYAELDPQEMPSTECLKDTVRRFLPFWHQVIAPAVKQDKSVIIAAHGNSLRALVKYLDDISDDEISKVNIPTGMPLIYELDDENLKPLKHYYLASEEEIKKATEKVANQIKKK